MSVYDTRSEAIVAALDDLTEPGDTLLVHEQHCTTGQSSCVCTPETWTYPSD